MDERTLLFVTMMIIVSGTLVLFIAQWWRNRGK